MARYFLEIWENGDRIPIGSSNGCEVFKEAERVALSKVDDASPHNTVHILKDMGYAGLAGDGTVYYEPAKKGDIMKKSVAKVSPVVPEPLPKHPIAGKKYEVRLVLFEVEPVQASVKQGSLMARQTQAHPVAIGSAISEGNRRIADFKDTQWHNWIPCKGDEVRRVQPGRI